MMAMIVSISLTVDEIFRPVSDKFSWWIMQFDYLK